MKPIPSLLRLAGVAALGTLSAAADAPAAAKTHTLFMGADFSVGTGDKVYPVKDVFGASWVVDVNGQDRTISTKEGSLNIKITPSLKLTKVSAVVSDLTHERGYTLANDPIARQTRALATAANVNAGYQAAVSQSNARLDSFNQQQNSVAFAGTANQASTRPPGGASGGTQFTPQQSGVQVAANATAISSGADLELTGDSRSTGFDAEEVKFGISSEKRLNNPYVVTVTRFHPKGSAPGVVQNLVYSKALDPIDVHPEEVRFLEEGFPADFEPVDFQLHLYDRGVEIATTVSSKRVLLTGDEAFEYVKMEYMAAHGKQTLAASPLMGQLPADLPSRLAEGKYRDTVYVRVSKDGLAADAFSDASCSRKLDDPYLESVVKSIRFKPALDNGKPVEGVVPLNLTRLAI